MWKLGADLKLYTGLPIHDSHRANLPAEIPIVCAERMKYTLWEQRWLARQCARDRIDVLHSPYNYGLPLRCDSARVLTLHDAIGAATRPAGAVQEPMLSRLRHWVARQAADRIITVSEFSKRDVSRLLGVATQKMVVVHGAADPRFAAPIDDTRRAAVRRRYALDSPYVFYVGGWEARKNLPFLLRAFADAKLSPLQLVLAGGNTAERTAIEALADSIGVRQQAKLIGVVPDDDLPALYAEATCFVYPSMYEGFGLQLCEAMSAGCPVLAADATSLPEILGDGGETFSLHEPGQLIGLLRMIHSDEHYRRQQRERALHRAAQFSWDMAARQTVAVYDRCLSNRFREA
jgi:glycosyltransferase involved in cell wall biosynthesis